MIGIPNVQIRPAAEASWSETILEERTKAGRKYTLRHKTAGVEPLFRVSVSAHESWGVIFYDHNGSKNGRWFETEAEARAMFEKWTAEG